MLNSGCQEWALAHAKQEADNRLQMLESRCVCGREQLVSTYTHTGEEEQAEEISLSLFSFTCQWKLLWDM